MNDWMEVLRTGTWTSSEGIVMNATPAVLDRIVAATTPKLVGDGVPAVIGHPKTDSPAWGWVGAIKRDGNTLLIQFRELVPEFLEMVRRGLFRNRSIALNSDYSLRHVGFLGATPPAVKGLAPIALGADAPFAVITFTEDTPMTFAEKLKQFLGLSEELNIPVTLPGAPPPKPADPAPKTFSEAELKTAADAAAEKARTDERTKLERTHALETRKAGITTFCDGLKAKGHLLPAWEKAGLQTFMAQLAERDELVTFADGAEKKTSLAWFQEFLGGLPKVVEFRAVADPKDAPKVSTLSATQQSINKQLGVSDELVTKFSTQN